MGKSAAVINEENDTKAVLKQSNEQFLDTVASMKGFESEIGDIYVCILFDLILYKYPELNYTAFELLIRFFNRKSQLLQSMANIQILESKKQIDILNKVIVYQTQLKIFQSEAEIFMNESDKSSREQKLRIAEIFQFLGRYCGVETPKPVTGKSSKMGSFFGGAPKLDENGEEAEVPERIEDLLLKLKDDDYVKENLQPDEDTLTAE